MIEKMANFTAKKLINNKKYVNVISETLSKRTQKEYKVLTDDEAINIIAYSLKTLYGELFKMILVCLLAYMMHSLIPAIIIMMVFSLYRSVAGGVHMNTYLKCFIMMIVLFLGGAVMVENLYTYYNSQFNMLIISLVIIVNIIIVKIYAPKGTPNRPITDVNEILVFKRLSFLFVGILGIIMYMLHNSNLFIISSAYGMMLELFTITPIGDKFFASMDKLLGNGE